MNFSANAGYSVMTNKNGLETDTVNYIISTQFFPGMKVSWSLFGNRTTSKVAIPASIGEYDITTTSYGASLNMNLNRSRGGNNNNNGNNNRFADRSPLVLPNIILNRTHTETESFSSANEARDDTKASISYRLNSSFDLYLDGELQEYENFRDGSSYDTTTTKAAVNWRISPFTELKLNGNMTDRTTHNMAGFNSFQKTESHSAQLNFLERGGFSHNYGYGFGRLRAPGQDFTTQSVTAQASKRIGETISVNGGAEYKESENTDKTATPERKDMLKSFSANGGVNYFRIYTPEFLGPFAFKTGYLFQSGISSYSSDANTTSGSGMFYTNGATLGLDSAKWTSEYLSLDYSFNSTRDHSPANSNTMQESYRLSMQTTRIPRTTVSANANYTVRESNQAPLGDGFFTFTSGSTLQQRSTIYNLNASHAATQHLNLTAGAARSENSSNMTTTTLSTLGAPPSVNRTVEDAMTAGADFSYLVTRNLQYKAGFREGYRTRKGSDDIHDRQVNMSLAYRIRMIFISLDYSWKQVIPENSLRTTQQYYLAKLFRPF